jgi:hypothetical protein
MSSPVRPDTPAAQRLRLLSDRRYLRLGRKAGLPPVPEVELPPPPLEATPRQLPDVAATAPIGPPPATRLPAVLEPQPGPLEQRLAAAAGVEAGRARRRGTARLLGIPGAAAAATEAERILGANLPGGVGEQFQRTAERHGEEERLAREAHPVAGLASDVGELYLELETLGRLPGPIGRVFREPGIAGAARTRGLFDAGGRVVATAEREATGTLAGRLARATGVEAGRFGALEAGKATAERRPPAEIAARGLGGAAGGAAFGAGGQASSELLALGIRSTLRRMARANLPGIEVPVRGRTIPTPEAPRLLPPPPEPVSAAGMPEHVATAGAAQRVALELVGQAPPAPRPPGQIVAPIADPALQAAGNELATLSLKPNKTDEDLARMVELQAMVRQAEPPPPEPHVPPSAAALPEREIPAEAPTFFPERRATPRPASRTSLPEGAPEVLGGTEEERQARLPKPGEEGTLPQPRRKNFQKYDDQALEARWIQINDRLEQMAGEAGQGINVWARTLPDLGTITGTAVTGAAGRALGRIKDDKRILTELEREFQARGINPHDVVDRYLARAQELQQSAEQTAERRAMELEGVPGGDVSFDVREPRGDYVTRRQRIERQLAKLQAEMEPPNRVREIGQFYSRVRRALAASPFEKGTGQQWLAYLEKVPGGTSREEREQTGIQALLEANRDKPVYQQELQFQIERQPLKLEEVVYGKQSRPEVDAARAAEERAYETYRAELGARGLSGSYAQDVIEFADVNQSLYQASVPKSFPARALVDDLKSLADALWAARRKVVELEAKHGIGVEGHRETAYGEYTLPGGQNYREIIVVAPPTGPEGARGSAAGAEAQRELARSMAERNGENWETLGPNGRQRYYDKAEKEIGLSYTSPHWSGVVNPVGHLRITDRTVRGEPTLFIEEIQSDVHQRGREEDYRKPADMRQLRDAVDRAVEYRQQLVEGVGRDIAQRLRVEDLHDETVPNPPWNPGHPEVTKVAKLRVDGHTLGDMMLWPSGAANPKIPDRLKHEGQYDQRGWVIWAFANTVQNMSTFTSNAEEALQQLRVKLEETPSYHSVARGALSDIMTSGLVVRPSDSEAWANIKRAEEEFDKASQAWDNARGGVPRLPLARTEDWAGLMVRRAIDAAVLTGKKRLAWTTGKQQAERYDTAIQEHIDRIRWNPTSGQLSIFKNNRPLNLEELGLPEHTKASEDLDAIVGKEVADKLRAQAADESRLTDSVQVEGADITIGGQGQRVFYDQILPKLIREQLRKLGGGKVEIEKPFMDVPTSEYDETSRRLRRESGVPYPEQPSEQPVWSVEIPDAVRKTVREKGLYVAEPSILSSPWLKTRERVTEAEAAFGGERQLEMALDKAVEQLQLKPEPKAKPEDLEKGVRAIAHYRTRAVVARQIATDLAKGQATWIGRQFPNVWPAGAQPKIVSPLTGRAGPTRPEETVHQVLDAAKFAKYRELVDGVGAMLQTLRSPFLETLVLFATRNDQIVVSHVLTSGALSFVSAEGKAGADLRRMFLEEAVAAGATHVHTAHNHPSGDPTPSGIGYDISMWGGFANAAKRHGLTPGNNLVIDDNEYTITELTEAPDGTGWRATPKFLPYRYSPKVPWFRPATGFSEAITKPDQIAAVVHRLGKAHNGYLIHLGSRGKIVGLDPFTPADVALGFQSPLIDQLASAMERYGAAETIIGVHDRELYDQVLRLYGESTPLQRGVLDIVTTHLQEGTGLVRWISASEIGRIRHGVKDALEQQWAATMVGRRVHESGPMAVPWRGQPGYTTDPAVQGSRSYQLPAGLLVDGPLSVREAVGPGYGEDGLPNTASVIAQEAIDAAEKLGIAPAAEGTIGKLLTSFAGTRMEQIGAPLHLVLVEYERQRAELEQLVQKDIVQESLNRSAVHFLAGLPYFTEFRAVTVLAFLRDKLPRVVGKQLGVTPDRQEALFNAAEAIAEFGPDGEPVFRDVLERSGELDQVGYDRLLKIYGHPAKLELEVTQLRQAIDKLRADMGRSSIALSPSAYAVERFKLGQRANQEAKKGAAAQILSQLKTERNVTKSELQELRASRDLHAKEGILDDDAAAALPAEIGRLEKQLNELRAQISRFEGVVSGRTPPGPPVSPKDLPAKLQELETKLVKWRELRAQAKEQDEVLRARWSNLRAFRRAYDAKATGREAGQVRITGAEARRRWAALSKTEQSIVRRFGLDADRAKQRGLEAHVNRELAKLEYEISSDIEAYVHHYGFEDEGAMVLWFGSALRRKKLIAGARQFRGGAEGFKRHLEGARLHGGLPLSLQKLQNEFAEALERVMFTTPDPNLVRPLGIDDDLPDGFTEVLGRFGELKGQRFAVANTVYRELEFFAKQPPQAPTTDALANKAWAATTKGVSRAIYYWALNQLLSVGTALRNFYSGAIQYASLVAEDLAGGDLYAAQKHLLALARAIAPANVRALPTTEFGASTKTLRTLDEAHGWLRAFMNTALVPFGMVENYFKRALTLATRELEAQRIAKEMLEAGTITRDQLKRVMSELFHAPTFEMRASEELVRDAFAYNYNNIPLALKKMNRGAIGKSLIPFPIYGYKFSRHVGRYTGAIGRLARMKGRAGDLQKALAAIIIFGLPAVLTWLGDEEGKAKTIDPGQGVKYDFDRSGRVYIGLNDQGLEEWLRTNQYSFYGLGAVIGHTVHDRTLTEAKNYVSEFYSVGPGFQAADYLRQVRNRYQTYRNSSAIAGDFARSWIPFHRPLETATRMVDPTRRKQETFTESMLYAVPVPEPVLNHYGLSRGEPRTAMGGRQLVPAYDPYLEFLKEFAGVNIKPIDPKQAQDEYRRAAIRAQVRERRSAVESQRLRRLEERRRQRQAQEP